MAVGVAIGSTIALLILWQQQSQADAAAQEHCTHEVDSSEARAATVVGQGRPVVVIGDSYSRGYGLADPDDSWPSFLAVPLGARVVVDGFDGTGFTDVNPCGSPYSARLPSALAEHPDLVIVQGGLNDAALSDMELRRGFRSLAAELGDAPRVVVVGPVNAPALAGDDRVDQTLAEMAGQWDVEYVRAYGWELPFQSDGIHLTPVGHRRFAERVAEAVVW